MWRRLRSQRRRADEAECTGEFTTARTQNPMSSDDDSESGSAAPAPVVDPRWWKVDGVADGDPDGGALKLGGVAISHDELDALVQRVISARPPTKRQGEPWLERHMATRTENPTNFHQAMAVLGLLSKRDARELAQKADLIDALYKGRVTQECLEDRRQLSVEQLQERVRNEAEHFSREQGEHKTVEEMRVARFMEKKGLLIRDPNHNTLRSVSPFALQRRPWFAWLLSFMLASLRLLAMEALLAGSECNTRSLNSQPCPFCLLAGPLNLTAAAATESVFSPSCTSNAECQRTGRPAFFCGPSDAAAQPKRCHHCGDAVTDPLLLGPEPVTVALLPPNATAFCDGNPDHQACLICPDFPGWGGNATCSGSGLCMPGWGDIDRATVAAGNIEAMKTSDSLVLILAAAVVSFHIAAEIKDITLTKICINQRIGDDFDRAWFTNAHKEAEPLQSSNSSPHHFVSISYHLTSNK